MSKGPPLLLAIFAAPLFGFVLVGTISAEPSSSADCATAVSRLVAAGNLDDLRWPDFSDYKIPVARFDEASAYAPARPAKFARSRQVLGPHRGFPSTLTG